MDSAAALLFPIGAIVVAIANGTTSNEPYTRWMYLGSTLKGESFSSRQMDSINLVKPLTECRRTNLVSWQPVDDFRFSFLRMCLPEVTGSHLEIDNGHEDSNHAASVTSIPIRLMVRRSLLPTSMLSDSEYGPAPPSCVCDAR